MTILVTGANGQISSMTIQQLRAAGAEVRAVLRDEAKAGPLRDLGCEVVIQDLDEEVPSSLFDGIERALFLTAPNPDAAKQMHHLIEAAKGSGVHVVRLSAIGAAADAPTDNSRLHFQSDEELKASGLSYTILRPSLFLQNLFGSMQSIAGEGKIYQGMGDGRVGMIDVRDVADACTALLLEGGHEGETMTLTGPVSVDWSEVAATISAVAPTKVEYVAVPPEAVKQSMLDMGWGDWGAQVMADYSQAYSTGWGDIVTDEVATVTGHAPRTVEAFAREVLAPALQTASA